MISDESAKELQHDKSIREESLSSEEQGLLEQGKASQDEAETGMLNLGQFLSLFFTLFLFQMRGMVGKRAVKSGFILSSLRPVYPPYKSWVKKKSSRT